MLNLYNNATRDPQHADLAMLNRYLTGKALKLIDGSLTSMAKSGTAYRGTPAAPRVKVQSVLSSSAVFLTSCPLASSSDPFVQYTVANGKPVRVAKRMPPPPYLLTLTVKRVGGPWKVSDIIQSAGATCHA